jgi:hypothetical protein
MSAIAYVRSPDMIYQLEELQVPSGIIVISVVTVVSAVY